MAGYIIGAAFVAFAIGRLVVGRRPADSIAFSGTVIEEVSKKSNQTGRQARTYAPRVSYQHPVTGADEVYEPTRFVQHRFTVGERHDLYFDRSKNEVRRPLDRPLRDTVALSAVGLGFIVVQFLAR